MTTIHVAKAVMLFIAITVNISAQAGGMIVHMFQSEAALPHIDNPELAKLMQTYTDEWQAGSQFPDTGYLANLDGKDHIWGETAHWAPFVMHYTNVVREKCYGRYTTDAACSKLTAHLMGVAAHGIQDQVFDGLFLKRVSEVDGVNQSAVDFGLDMVVAMEHDRSHAIPSYWYVPTEEIMKVMQRMNLQDKVNPASLLATGYVSGTANVFERVISPSMYGIFKGMMPWASRNYMHYPGGIISGGELTAQVWNNIWQRLNEPLVLLPKRSTMMVYPKPNQTNVPTDLTETESAINIVFDRPYQAPTIDTSSLKLTDEKGMLVAGRFEHRHLSQPEPAQAYIVRFSPIYALKPNHRYTIVLASSVLDDLSQPMTSGFTWSFTTEPQRDYMSIKYLATCLTVSHPHASLKKSLTSELEPLSQPCMVKSHTQDWYWQGKQLRNRESDLCLTVSEKRNAWFSSFGKKEVVMADCVESTSENNAQAWKLENGRLVSQAYPMQGMTFDITGKAKLALKWFVSGWSLSSKSRQT